MEQGDGGWIPRECETDVECFGKLMPNRLGATKGGSAGVRQRKLESRSVSELLQAPRIYLKVLASYHGQQLSAWIFGCADLKLFGIPVVPPAMQPQRPLVVC